jgi:hypothetical protein
MAILLAWSRQVLRRGMPPNPMFAAGYLPSDIDIADVAITDVNHRNYSTRSSFVKMVTNLRHRAEEGRPAFRTVARSSPGTRLS